MVSFVVALIALGAGVIALTRVGSLTQAFGFEGSDFVGQEQKRKSGDVVVPSLQQNPSIPIPQGSQVTVDVIKSDKIIRTDIASKRKFNVGSSKPIIKTTFNNPNEGGSEPQAGILLTSNNSLKNTVLGLNEAQRAEIRAQPFTKQELEDIQALTSRFNAKSSASQRVSDSGVEIVLKKREQARIAERFVNIVTSFGGTTRGGFVIPDKRGLNLNPDFVLGGKSLAEFNADQESKRAITLKQEQNRALATQREATGTQIISTIAKSGMNQKQFLLTQGIALRGGDLNPKAIAKLREKGLI